MSFNIDRQTIEELNLPGKFRSGSVYSLFNQVKTRGGEQLLDKIFLTPLDDEEAINQRTGIFEFFEKHDVTFPADPYQVNLMREYLDTNAGQAKVREFANTIVRKLLSGLTRDERHKRNLQGLQATIVVLNSSFSFLETLADPPSAYVARIKEIKDILSDKRLERLRNTDIYRSLSLNTLIFYNHLLKNVLQTEVEKVLSFIYELDVYMSVGGVARKRNFVFAKAFPADKNIFSVTDLSHPCVERAIGNSLLLNEDQNVLFLTGANMAGKSTLMKSVGIAIYLAHIGFPVAAMSMSFSVKDGLYSSINVADNIGLGYSHFYAEVIRVKQAAEAVAAGKKMFLMFDELFKGTNVKDAYDGTLAVTEGFADYKNCLFIVSTHIIEVGEALKLKRNIKFAFMPTLMNGSRPQYTYELQEGITEDRQGMIIIKNEGILELIGE